MWFTPVRADGARRRATSRAKPTTKKGLLSATRRWTGLTLRGSVGKRRDRSPTALQELHAFGTWLPWPAIPDYESK
jgi:hypothetical protein